MCLCGMLSESNHIFPLTLPAAMLLPNYTSYSGGVEEFTYLEAVLHPVSPNN